LGGFLSARYAVFVISSCRDNLRDHVDATTLRKATQTDAATLAALYIASWHETYTGIIPGEMLAGSSV